MEIERETDKKEEGVDPDDVVEIIDLCGECI